MSGESILNNTTLWYSVAVGAFALVGMWKIRGPILGWLDSEIARVRAELDEAKKLHAEAEATLAEYKAKQQDAAKEAEAILNEARLDASRLRAEAEAELKAALERHEQLFIDRLKLAHEDAMEEVRNFVIDEVLIEARGKLKKVAATDESTALVDKIIADLPKLHKGKVA